MSVDQNVLKCLSSSVTAATAEANAKSAVASWKTLCAQWTQETADAVGKLSAEYAVKWNNAVIPEIESRINECKIAYEEKKADYDAANQLYHDAERAVKDAQDDMEKCMDYPDTSVKDGMFAGMNDTSIGKKKVVVDHYGYNEAKKREAVAKAESSKCKAEADRKKSAMTAAESALSKAKKEKEALVEKIEDFILGVYQLNLMDESVAFLTTIKSSTIYLSSKAKNTLFSRLFLIQNEYRKQFEEFQMKIKGAGNLYETSVFTSTPEKLSYTAIRKVKGKKFAGKISISLVSDSIATASYSFESKNDFVLSGKNPEEVKAKVQPAFKAFTSSINRSNFTAELNKSYENKDIESQLTKLTEDSDSYVQELIAILDILQANGASNSKIKVLIGKLMNWHLDHWPKLWYKIASLSAAGVLSLAIILGASLGVNSSLKNAAYKKSFAEWTTNYSKTNELLTAKKRIAVNDSFMRFVTISTIPENELNEKIETVNTRYTKFVPIDEAMDSFFKQSLAGVLPQSSVVNLYITYNEYEGAIYKRKNSKKHYLKAYNGVISVTTGQDGSIESVSDLTGNGFGYF